MAHETTHSARFGRKRTHREVTWSVRPDCAKLDINSLHAWASGGNVFEEDYAHGVRPLVTEPELLAPID